MKLNNKYMGGLSVLLLAGIVGGGVLLAGLPLLHVCSPRIPGEHYPVGDTTGLEVSHYANGNRNAETHYRDGWRHGEHTEWHHGGQRTEHGFYDSGKHIGTWEAWYWDGSKEWVAEFDSEGSQSGAYTRWYPSGDLAYRASVESGSVPGIRESWHPNGCPEWITQSDEGGTVSRKAWYATGAVRLVTAAVQGDGERLRYTRYYEDGTPESDGQRARDDGANEGGWRYWTAAGELDSERTGFYWGGTRLMGFFAPAAEAPVPPAPPRLPVALTYSLHWLESLKLQQGPGLRPARSSTSIFDG